MISVTRAVDEAILECEGIGKGFLPLYVATFTALVKAVRCIHTIGYDILQCVTLYLDTGICLCLFLCSDGSRIWAWRDLMLEILEGVNNNKYVE